MKQNEWSKLKSSSYQIGPTPIKRNKRSWIDELELLRNIIENFWMWNSQWKLFSLEIVWNFHLTWRHFAIVDIVAIRFWHLHKCNSNNNLIALFIIHESRCFRAMKSLKSICQTFCAWNRTSVKERIGDAWHLFDVSVRMDFAVTRKNTTTAMTRFIVTRAGVIKIYIKTQC